MSKERFEAWNASKKHAGYEVHPTSATAKARYEGWQASKADSLQQVRGMVEQIEIIFMKEWSGMHNFEYREAVANAVIEAVCKAVEGK